MRVTADISIEESELDESFIRASGPGGQNVNKVSSAVELRFDMRRSRSLPAPVKTRLAEIAGTRLTKDGVIVIRADRFRTQERNRTDARARLAAMIAEAAVAPKFRVKTRPTLGSKERRLEGKANRSGVKRLRRERPTGDEG